MKSNKSLAWTFAALVVIAALYRVIPNRPLGFAPQIAMALFAGAVIKDRKWAFALPIFSMLISDVLYQILYAAGLTDIRGFYGSQIATYLLLAGITVFGFTMKKINIKNVLGYSIASPTLFFLASNMLVWLAGQDDVRTNLPLPKTVGGLLQCYAQALPFYTGALMASVFFSALLFGGYMMLSKRDTKAVTV
ncbi:MAG: hypothetical protein H7Y27_01445 [Gemmatimonadaceae bacterium]|nr:hypothetical protein [Chitinophagaceae bacterium]